MKKKYIKVGILLLLFTRFTVILQAQESLYVHNVDGKQKFYLIRTIDKLTFPGEDMLITFTSTPSANFPISEIQYCNFKYLPDWNHYPNPLYTIRIFPNPTIKEVSIESDVDIYQITVYNILGQKLTQVLGSPDRTIVPLSSYSPGCYMLQIMTSAGIVTEKIIKINDAY